MKNYRFIGLIHLCFIMLTSITSFAQTVPEEAQKYYYRGQAAMELAKSPTDYQAAIAEYTKAASLAPTWPDVQLALGQVYEKIAKYTDAVVCYKKYIELAPNAANTASVKANIYKLEYKLEKEGDRQKIINVITSSSYKVISGEFKTFSCGMINKFILNGNKLNVYIKCNTPRGNMQEWDQTVPAEFDGSILSFKYHTYNCPTTTELKQYPCDWEVNIKAEVISNSPLRFKVKETFSRQFSGEYVEYYFSEWEFNQQ